jgi:hypothetical protein
MITIFYTSRHSCLRSCAKSDFANSNIKIELSLDEWASSILVLYGTLPADIWQASALSSVDKLLETHCFKLTAYNVDQQRSLLCLYCMPPNSVLGAVEGAPSLFELRMFLGELPEDGKP